MEDQEYEAPINSMLRKQALQHAVSVYAVFMQYANFDAGDPPHSDRLVETATKFYNFLKGDTK